MKVLVICVILVASISVTFAAEQVTSISTAAECSGIASAELDCLKASYLKSQQELFTQFRAAQERFLERTRGVEDEQLRGRLVSSAKEFSASFDTWFKSYNQGCVITREPRQNEGDLANLRCLVERLQGKIQEMKSQPVASGAQPALR